MSHFLIKNEKGTYYTGWTGIGPKFGGTEKEAMKFATLRDAAREMGRHSFAFTLSDIEEVNTFI